MFFLLLDSDLVSYITNWRSSRLYLDGKENITGECFA